MYNVGIVGFGVVGRSILSFLNEKKGQAINHDDHEIMRLSIWDARVLSAEEQLFINDYGASVIDPAQVSLEDFLRNNDYIVASPGVDLNDYQKYHNKFLCELDFFSTFFSKPVIAITGALGKTTTTKLLGKLTSLVSYLSLEQKKGTQQNKFKDYFGNTKAITSVIGGNIGIGMLDLVKQQESYDLGVLELSSFQLELNKKFAPDIAIFTNFYANHLDRHKTLEAYFEAKFSIIRYQRPDQIAILSLDLLTGDGAHLLNNYLPAVKSQVCFVAQELPDQELLKKINRPEYLLFYVKEHNLYVTSVRNSTCEQAFKLFDLTVLPATTFLSNWLQILTTLYILGADLLALEHIFKTDRQAFVLDDHHHRVEYFATINHVDFYNDSKSTVIQATQAAVEQLARHNKPIILILGGLSKGVDRSPLVSYLKTIKNIKKVYCFGKDSDVFLSNYSDARTGEAVGRLEVQERNIGCTYFPTLEEIIQDIKKTMKPGDLVLFSPSGSSFDLFKNYEHRGQVFKDLVLRLKA